MMPVSRFHFPACALLLFMAGLLSAGCGGKRAEQLQGEGDEYFNREMYSEAKASYTKALAADPSNATAQLQLGRCMEIEGNSEGALEAFEATLALDPTYVDAYLLAAKTLLNREPQEAAAALDVAERLVAQDQLKGNLLRSVVLRAAGRIDEAVTLLEGLRDREPESVEPRVALAKAYLETRQHDKSEAEVRYVLDNLEPNSIMARGLLIEVLREQPGKTDEMVAEFEELVNNNPDDIALKEVFARALLYAERYTEAEATGTMVLERAPESMWASFVVGVAKQHRGATEEAKVHLETALRLAPDDQEALRQDIENKLRIAMNGGGQPPAPAAVQESVPEPAQVTEETPGTWQDLWKRADLKKLVQQRDEYLAAGDPLVRETVVLAAVFIGDLTSAREVAAELGADSPYTKYLDVLAGKDVEELRTLFQDWTVDVEDKEQNLLRENALGYACGRAGARGQAMTVLQNAHELWPENVVSLYNLAMIFRQSGQPRYAARALQNLLRDNYENLDVQLLQFDTLRESGLYKEAENLASTTYLQYPDNPRVVLNYAEILLDQKQSEFALTMLERAQGNLPDEVNIVTATASLHLRLGELDEAKVLLDGIQGTPSNGVAEARAILAAAMEDWAGVVAQMESVPKQEQSLGLILMVAAAHGKTGNTEAAASDVAAIRASSTFWLQPLGTALRGAFALPEAEAGPFAQALQGATSARNDFLAGAAFEVVGQSRYAARSYLAVEAALPNAHGITDHLYRVLIRELDDEFARETADAVLARHAGDAESQLNFARLSYAKGEISRVGVAISKAIEADPQSASAWMNKGRFEEQENNIAEALEAYRNAVKFAPEDAVANNNLAYLLLQNNVDPQEALVYAKKAAELRPGNPDILHTLGRAQLKAGELDASQKTLRLAMEFKPGEPTIMYDIGQLLIAQGEKDKGAAQIGRAILYAESLGLDFPDIEEAREFMVKFVEEAKAAGG